MDFATSVVDSQAIRLFALGQKEHFVIYIVDLLDIHCIRDCPHYGIANRRCRPPPAG